MLYCKAVSVVVEVQIEAAEWTLLIFYPPGSIGMELSRQY